jgi:hypothetical protein
MRQRTVSRKRIATLALDDEMSTSAAICRFYIIVLLFFYQSG